MACIVYREGTGTEEHGIVCESTTCEVGELDSLLANGWSQNPPGYIPPEPVVADEEFPENDEGGETGVQLETLKAEVTALGAEIENLQKQLELREGIEANLNATIDQLKEDLETASKIEDRLNSELAKARKPADSEEVDPIRAAGRDAGIEGWETMHLATLKKTIKELEA